LAKSRMRLWHILEFRLCLRLGELVRPHHGAIAPRARRRIYCTMVLAIPW
jgi:hypothetical protein